MKIAWIRIKGFQQFEDTFIDFRHPETGEPLNKVCLIGRNGTGKSTILELLYEHFSGDYKKIKLNQSNANRFQRNYAAPFIIMKIKAGTKYFIVCSSPSLLIFSQEIEAVESWIDKLYVLYQKSKAFSSIMVVEENALYKKYSALNDIDSFQLYFHGNSQELVTFCPSESQYNALVDIEDVPDVNLNQALQLNNKFSFFHIVSNQTITEYWRLLIYLIKKRDSDRDFFEKQPANIEKSKRLLIEEFDRGNPDILRVISVLWNEILERAGLKFDYENAKIPIQLTENLLAYIVSKYGVHVPYNKLSTGIRNFIFRFGHIKTLYFNREIKRGLLLVDEPENSLFPDFLLNIIEKYAQVTTDKNGNRNTQMFFATHSPIIASQFEPHERIILDWDENGSVKARKGTAPEGDDPNDILYQDFGMTEIVSKKGQEVWKAYLDLKKRLSREKDEVKKKEIAEEILEIGHKYNFEK